VLEIVCLPPTSITRVGWGHKGPRKAQRRGGGGKATRRTAGCTDKSHKQENSKRERSSPLRKDDKSSARGPGWAHMTGEQPRFPGSNALQRVVGDKGVEKPAARGEKEASNGRKAKWEG